MTFKAPDSLAEQIAHHLAERIIRGDLKPGERIQEQKVTQALNVSRGSVREALLILERRHLVGGVPGGQAGQPVGLFHRLGPLPGVIDRLQPLQGGAHLFGHPADRAAGLRT